MSVELTMLVYSTFLFLAIILAQAGMAIAQNGAMAQAGSRDNLPQPSVLRLRMQRLTANMQENLIMFAIAVLAAGIAGVSNETTVLGATIFFYARLGHAIAYALGLPLVRPLFYFAGVYGVVAILLELVL